MDGERRGAARVPKRKLEAKVRVRDLRWEDFPELTDQYWRLYEERAAGGRHGITLQATKPSLEHEVDWFAAQYKRFLRGDTVAVVAEVDGSVAGLCTIGRVGPTRDAENGHQGELGILVGARYRGRGVGHALLRAALHRARGSFEVVRLGVHSSNLGARHLYEKFGFRPSGRIPRAVRRGGEFVDEELMALLLPARPRRRA